MALSAAIVFEARSATGNDANGAGFKAGATGTDRSQQDAAQVAIGGGTVTTSITTSVITFTGGTYTATAADVGNVVQMISGTNVSAGFFEIISQTGTTWTVDRNVVTSGTTTNAVGNMGGALGAGAIGKLKAAMVASNKAYLKGAGFSETATGTFTATHTPTGAAPFSRLIGYGTTRGDGTHAAMVLATNTGLTALSFTAGWSVEQLDINCQSLGTSTGVSFGNFCHLRDSKISNFTTAGITSASVAISVDNCEFTGGGSAATAAVNLTGAQVSVLNCFVRDNACPGIIVLNDSVANFNLIANNSGASSDGLRCSYHAVLKNNTIHGNGRDGIRCTSTNPVNNEWRDNILSSNGGYGITGASTTAIPAAPEYDGNAYFSNTSGTRNLMDSTTGILGVAPYTNVRDVTLTGSPYVGGTTGTTANFALNNTAGAGAACRAAALPGTWPGNTGTTGYLDMGAVQHRDSGGMSRSRAVMG